jgi:ABC-type nitrate/sulfonate/bicarbonate transport system substrate-binding protein
MIRERGHIMIRQLRVLLLGLFAISVCLVQPAWAQRAERIKISYTATAMSLLPVFFGVDQGVYRDEGFQVDLVRISGGNIIPSALMNRELDYTSSANFSLFAGLPIRTIGAMQVKTPLTLVVRPEIKTGADLKGKSIAIARPGSLTDNIAREFARHFGLNPDKGEITTLGLGDHSGRIIALQTNRVQAAILDAPSDVQVQALGFRILASSADLFPETLQNGLTTSLAKLQDERPQAKRVLRAFVKTQILTVERPDLVVPFVMKYWKIDKPTAEKSYNQLVKTFTKDGTPSKESLVNAVAFALQVTKGTRSISVEDVYTGELLAEVHRELGLRK